MKKSHLPIQIFSHALIFFFAVSFPRTLRFQLSKKDKKMTPEEKPKRTENEEENPHLHQNWCQYHLQCSHHRLPFWSRLEPRCDCSTGCCLHLRNSFSIFQQCHLLLLVCELHAVIFFMHQVILFMYL